MIIKEVMIEVESPKSELVSSRERPMCPTRTLREGPVLEKAFSKIILSL
jgi:hypothetical protein